MQNYIANKIGGRQGLNSWFLCWIRNRRVRSRGMHNIALVTHWRGIRLLWTTFLSDQGFVDMRNDAAASNGCLNKAVQLLVSADGELQMTGSDTLHLEIFGSVAGQLEYLCREVFQNSCRIYGSCCADASMASCSILEVAMYTANRELQSGTSGARHGLCFGLSRIFSCFTSGHVEDVL